MNSNHVTRSRVELRELRPCYIDVSQLGTDVDPESPILSSVTLTDEEVQNYSAELDQRVKDIKDAPVGMPPPPYW